MAAFQSEVVTATFSSGPVPVGNICFFINSYMYNHQVTIFFCATLYEPPVLEDQLLVGSAMTQKQKSKVKYNN